MNSRLGLAIARIAFGLLTLAALLVQLADSASRGVLVPANFFSYFTVQSNLIGAAVLLIAAARWRAPRSATFDLVRGAAVLCLTVTLIVFAVLLSGTDVDVAVPWVNTVVHEIFPLAVLADWLIDPPRRPIPFRRSLVWLVYPLAWTAYTVVRGALVGWYPYPFLDPAHGGYASVALYVVAILVFGILLAALIAAIGSAVGRRRSATLDQG